MVLGGEVSGAASSAAAIRDTVTGITTPLAVGLTTARSGQTATLLADGTILVMGGRTALGRLAETAELFDPQSGAFMPIAFEGGTARTGHTATLLPDGRVLVVGGVDAGGQGELGIEIWEPQAQRAQAIGELGAARTGHAATLTNDGRVVVSGGADESGRPSGATALIDPISGRTVAVAPPVDNGAPAHVTGSSPANGAMEVPIDARLVVALSRPLRVATVNADTVRLQGAEGTVDVAVVPAEGGRLVFLTPRASLRFDASYTLAIAGAVDALGVAIAAAPITFMTTKEPSSGTAAVDEEAWMPDERSRQNGWRSERPPSPWEALPPLMAAPGVTAIRGRVLTLDGSRCHTSRCAWKATPTPARMARGGSCSSCTPPRRAAACSKSTAALRSRPTAKYGFFEDGATVAGGTTNVLPFTIWMPKLDTAHQVTILSPTTREVVVTTPDIPGLELHLPAGTTITGEDGKPVTTLGITPIPVDRPPFPLARNVEVPVDFTISRVARDVHTPGPGPRGASLVYPNTRMRSSANASSSSTTTPTYSAGSCMGSARWNRRGGRWCRMRRRGSMRSRAR